MTPYIREIADELHEVITNINRAFINGEFDHLPDPLGERDRLINDALMNTKFERTVHEETAETQDL